MKQKTAWIVAAVVVIVAAGAIGIIIGLRSAGQIDIGEYMSPAPFEMTEIQTDRAYNSNNETVKLVSFILTNCPDGACPMTMLDFEDVQAELKADGLFGSDVELLSITFDPSRDTPEILSAYAQAFNADPDGWKFLRADGETIRSVADDFEYVYALGDDGSAVHGITVYIMDRNHQVRSFHRMTNPDGTMDVPRAVRELRYLARRE